MSSADDRIVIIGAGMGGLSAALALSAQGLPVTVLDRAAAPGGKMRTLEPQDRPIDVGPTVFTMRWVFEALFDGAGLSFADHLDVKPAQTLARHSWGPGERLDLFADERESADAIAAFSGPEEGRRYLAFCARAREIFQTLETSFMQDPDPSPFSLVRHAGLGGLGALWRIEPFTRLWQALGRYFKDDRLRQLFGRYATYAGSSPFQAPATLMLIAHVEQDGVWYVEGGMHRLAQALAGAAAKCGADIRYNAHVDTIGIEKGGVRSVTLASGERIEAGAVILNADASALGAGAFGADAARAVPALPVQARSLSAMTWAMEGRVKEFPLCRHTVFFSRAYKAEFDAIAQGHMPDEPTVYICAQDRGDAHDAPPAGGERLFCLINAPATGDRHPFDRKETDLCAHRMFQTLSRCGLTIEPQEPAMVTTPADFERLFPKTGGALYGRASHGWQASFQRPKARTRIKGLYLAGGSIHPGAGVPMAALSGLLSARCLMADRASTRPSVRAVMPGGMWMP